MEEKTTRRYRGKGRKPAKEKRIFIRVTAAEKAQYIALGGSKAFRLWLKGSAEAGQPFSWRHENGIHTMTETATACSR